MKSKKKSVENELLKKFFYTFFIILICRFGAYIPLPGIDSNALSLLTEQNKNGILGMLNLLSGGALGRMSIFALAVMPYITSSIVIQLLTVTFKSFELLKKEGETGKRKLAFYTRVLTLLLALFQSFFMAKGVEGLKTTLGPVVILSPLYFKMIATLTLSVGTIFLMWLGDQINIRGIGNGISLIIFSGIVAALPSSFISIFELSRTGVISVFTSLIIIFLVLFLIGVIVFFERAQKKIMVQYPKRQVGNKLLGGDVTHIPLKLNTSGVIPPLFASSMLLFPLTIASFSGQAGSVLNKVAFYLDHGKPLYIMLYAVLITFFCFFYTSIVFNAEETALNLKKHGAFIPGKRPGSNTADYFDYVLTRITVIGALYLCLICCLPELLISKYSVSLNLTGTSLLIMVNVVIEVLTQVQTYLFNKRYESVIRKIKVTSR